VSAPALGALFDPEGVIVAGASSHPGKFGFVVLHNILRYGYRGRVFATNVDGGTILDVPAHPSVECIPSGAADLVFVCTPVPVNAQLLRDCAARGVRAAFVMTGGYAELGEDGRRAQDELVAAAAESGIALAGPNGQGIVSTPSSLCAQMVAPYPPAGRIGIASQSGNIVSSLENLAIRSGIGVSRAVSAGNAAVVGIGDYLEYFASDDATDVSVAYVEDVRDGRALFEALRRAARQQPIVMVRGGATAGGRRAAASHTGALASDHRVFAGMCRQAGVNLATTVEEAFDAAATFATQPLPRGPRVAVLTTAGGWGVLTADALARSDLELLTLPSDLRDAIDGLLPPRWSRQNATPSPKCSASSAGIKTSTRCCSSARACSRTRRGRCGQDASRRATTSSGSRPSTSVRTRAMRRLQPRCPTRVASPCWWPPSWRSPTRTTPDRALFARPVACVTRRRTVR